MDTEIITERLLWRQMRAEDTDLYHPIMSDWDVVRMLGSWPWPPDRDFTAQRCANRPEGDALIGPIFLGEEMIGGMGIHDGGMGYMIAQAHWGRGYATEMGRAMIAEAFRRFEMDEIKAEIWDDNPASGRVLEKLGFRLVGHHEDFCKARGEAVGSLDFLLTRADWEAVHGH